MLFSLLDTKLAFIDILLLIIIAGLEYVFYRFKKKSKKAESLKYIIPLLIIGVIIFLTIKNTVQEIVPIISIGLLSIFYIFVCQIKYDSNNERRAEIVEVNYLDYEDYDDFEFKAPVEEDEDIEDGSEQFGSLIDKIYKEQRKDV